MTEEKDNANIIDELGDNQESNNASGELGNLPTCNPDELKILNDKYLRLAAEFDNYKRLAQRDQRDQVRFGNEQIIKELLPVVDNLERAIKAANESGSKDSLTQGVELTLKQLSAVLQKFGVQPIPTVGQEFDPSGHQAVTSVPSSHVPEHHVVEEFQRGYRLHDRILRAAMVSVSTGGANTAS
ncbi:Protein GrpE [Nitrospira sp. KM1]|uniref:nucleotide exchange factor GrpE n=1 Tax=Nitrospira sp. KM1 TaxID=1936990 RepID=UPI0013A786AA|nr:nucleotide exchange factor GrpE [Nitrospira sp. KM1]BCA53170.1 Protein GrpE [Nitrospira sp. KM1]